MSQLTVAKATKNLTAAKSASVVAAAAKKHATASSNASMHMGSPKGKGLMYKLFIYLLVIFIQFCTAVSSSLTSHAIA